MKRISKLISLLLAAALICSLLPTAVFAASGRTEADPIPIPLGEITEVPLYSASGDWEGAKYFIFTAEKGGEYTFLDYSGNSLEGAIVTGKSTYLYPGETHTFLCGSHWVQVIDEGRMYYGASNKSDQYVIWDFVPEEEALHIFPGRGDGEMAALNGDRYLCPYYAVEERIKHVYIEEGVTSVCDHAFASAGSAYDGGHEAYVNLMDVHFPSTLRRIGKEAFYKCPWLTMVQFPAALEYIGDMAFFYCPHLKKVTFEGPTALSWGTFEGCTELEEVNVLDPNMRDFGLFPFYNSPWIRTLAKENKGAAVVNNVLIGAYQAYDKEEGDGILVIPDGVTKIAKGALNGTVKGGSYGGDEGSQHDWYLEEIVIPDSVTEIAYDSFLGGPFSGCYDLERVTIGDGVTVIPPHCFGDCYELRIVNFGKNIRQICDYAFHDTWLPGDLEIPDSVISIGKQAFYNDEFPLGASWIPEDFGIFDKVYRPKDFTDRYITIGANVKVIGDKAFWGWTLESDDPLMPGGTATIRGYDGTCAQQWAEKNNFGFKSLGAAPAAQPLFRDVPLSVYYAEPVTWAVGRGVTNGTSPTTFSPNNTCTRAQVVTFLWRAAGQPLPDAYINPFTDVKPTDYFYYAVLWAYHKDITRGSTATTFSPNAPCTRGQVVTFLLRAKEGYYSNSGTYFTDVPEDAYYADAVAWAADHGITKGTGNGHFSPEKSCSRAEIVTFLYRANK